jgi:hypothetical protein
MSNAVLLTTSGFDANYRVDRVNGPAPIGVSEFRRPDLVTKPAAGIELHTAAQKVVFKVTPEVGEQWIGEFWGGAEGVDGVFATPNADTLCIVVKGQGYWVPVREPTAFDVVRSIPIKRVLPVQNPAVLIFVNYTRLSAYGPQGFMWTTEDLSWDGLEILDVAAGTVRGTAWDSPAGRDTPFSVDIATGKAEGGSSPAKYGAASK